MNDLIGWYTWQLTPDHLKRVDSLTGEEVDLPPLPHGERCHCGYCLPKQEGTG